MATGEFSQATFRRGVSRRRFLQASGFGAAGLASALVVGCENKPAGGTAPTTASSTIVTPRVEQPVRGGTFTVVQPGDIGPQNIMFTGGVTNFYVLGSIFERLMHYRTDRFEMEPELATSWQFAPDYASLTIKLRTDVKFHTGRSFSSADVKWGLEKAAEPASGSQMLNMLAWVKKVETPDPATVVLTLDQARPTILDVFEYFQVADPETFADSQQGKRFVGTGPFMFKEWVPGDHVTMTRNPDYWQKDRPYLDQVIVKVIPEPQTELINVQTGAADLATGVDPRDINSLRNDKNYTLVANEVMTGLYYMGVDIAVPPFTDKRVRQAVGCLLDRKRIIDTLVFFGEPSTLPWDKASPAYTADLAEKLAYNPTKAKELVTQAGVGAGVTVPISISTGYPVTLGMAEMFQAELAKLGWKSTIEKYEPAPFQQMMINQKYAGIWFSIVGFMHMSPASLFVMARPYRVPGNSSNYDTPEYRKLIADMLKASGAEEAKKLYRQMNETLIDESFLAPIVGSEIPRVMTAKAKGMGLRRSSIPIMVDLWKSK